MSKALRECASSPDVQARLRQAFAVPIPMESHEFARLARDAAEADAGMFRAAGIRMDG